MASPLLSKMVLPASHHGFPIALTFPRHHSSPPTTPVCPQATASGGLLPIPVRRQTAYESRSSTNLQTWVRSGALLVEPVAGLLTTEGALTLRSARCGRNSGRLRRCSSATDQHRRPSQRTNHPTNDSSSPTTPL